VRDTVDATMARDLGERLQRGDVQAFEALYEDLHPMVFNLAARITGDREASQDITQDVFLRSFRAFPNTTGQLRPEAWLVRSTVNACHDHLRASARRSSGPLEDDHHVAERHDGFEQSATVEAVESALARMNPKYRTAILLKDLQGLSNGEVAEAMGVRRGSIGVLLFRARNAFKKAYRETAAGGALLPAGLVGVLPRMPVPATLSTPPFRAALAAGNALEVAAAPVVANAEPMMLTFTRLFEPLGAKIAVVAAAAAVTAGAGVVAGADRSPAASRAPTDEAAVVAPSGGSAAQEAFGLEVRTGKQAGLPLQQEERLVEQDGSAGTQDGFSKATGGGGGSGSGGAATDAGSGAGSGQAGLGSGSGEGGSGTDAGLGGSGSGIGSGTGSTSGGSGAGAISTGGSTGSPTIDGGSGPGDASGATTGGGGAGAVGGGG
jgi:RNA polymerase sigma factor (sigma-70 family)